MIWTGKKSAKFFKKSNEFIKTDIAEKLNIGFASVNAFIAKSELCQTPH
jgi:hypothetical protein